MVPFIISQNLTSFDDYSDQKDGLFTPVDHFSEHHHISTFNSPTYEADSQFSSHQNFDPVHPEGSVIGNPGYDMQFWHKQSFNDCDVVAQQMGLESLTARHFSESALLHEAIHDGSHLATGGTPADYIGHLYETHGFPIERHHDATMDELKEKLAEGQKVVVAVNSQILWANESHVPEFSALPANHSVEVIGVVYPYNDSEHPKVILNDPGIDNGQGVMVPLEQFEHAWATSNHLMAAAHTQDSNSPILTDVSSIIGSAGLNNGAGTYSSDDTLEERNAKDRVNAYEQESRRQQAAEEERQRQLREEQRQEELRRENERREEQRREEALREQQQREREQQQREEQQRAEQLKEEHRREEMLREERQ